MTAARLTHPLTLLRVFVLASALLLGLGAVVLGSILARSLEEQALENAKREIARYAEAVLAPEVADDGGIVLTPEAEALFRRQLETQTDLINIKLWASDGVLVWTSIGPERIGRRFSVDGQLGEVLRSGTTEAEIEEPRPTSEHEAEARLGIDRALEVYSPIRDSAGRIVGAWELYEDPAALDRFVSERRRVIWLATFGVFGALWALLALLVRKASRVLQRQSELLRERTAALAEAYEQLEASSLEAVESLNATVEAKDPYTAGHSLRVQRVALAIAMELKLSREEIDALRFGALFHDIGKIAVPDQILTKPDRLTYWEWAQVKLHSAEGARIVAKFGRLRNAVPVIRHHHERWDGNGYPDARAGEQIPVTASVVALADAWDAMLTDRPYASALTIPEALEEVRRNRGTQFAPAVVDAFFEAVRKRPVELGLGDVAAAAS